ncbi:protein BIG GRAIN 1-like B [Impatiens glandulifera]|uniref:protein BIG GRAIN 1-like B n=1 Tax=Impatiens glandulifera TaxID=253017 RepID=UPI001FB0D8B1|nr:protein BIG GRAIN 1-like B [Impatiens glandulifera]
MDHKQYKSLKLKDNRYPQNPSTFSSTLLDAIYRSIDDDTHGAGAGEHTMVYRETKKQTCSGFEYEDEVMAKHRRSRLIEKWMEKKKVTQTEKIVIRRRSVPDFDRNPWGLTHSSSSSSDSSSGGGFSSSETESIYGYPPPTMKLNPLRTMPATASKTEEFQKQRKSNKTHDSKSKAVMKIFNDLKKAKKQPISPGGRLASFLNSLFTANKSKSDENTPATATATESKSGHASTCSSASSFSRSCLSTGSSKTAKRSVRFNVDDDYQPYSRQKSSYNNSNNNVNIPKNTIKNEVKIQIMEKMYHHQHQYNHKMSHEDVEMGIEDHEEEDDDDAASYASSDLFELDNLSSIGNGIIDRYCKELPVYETTHVHTNRAIANGLIA